MKRLQPKRWLQLIYMTGWEAAARRQEKREAYDEIPGARNLKTALVKLPAFVDFYSEPAAASPEALIASTNHRSGPVALITKLKADYYIIAQEPDEECRIWEKKVRRRYPAVPPHHAEIRRKQAERAVKADSVDWSRYDLVFAIENAIPARITRRFPNVLWATMLEDHRVEEFKQYMKRPPKGYDLFFTQHFGPTLRSVGRRPHVIEWPYGLACAGCVASLFPESQKTDAVMLEGSQPEEAAKFIGKQGKARVYEGVGRRNWDYLKVLTACKVFFAPQFVLPRWGNATVEAAAADCVVVGDRRIFWSPAMIEPAMHRAGLRDGWPIVRRLLEDKAYYEQMLERQRARLDWFAFHRPFLQIRGCLKGVPRPLAAKKTLGIG